MAIVDVKPDKAWHEPWVEEPSMTVDEAKELLVDPEKMRQHVVRRSRVPFQEVLARMLSVEPERERLEEFARQNPDKWSKMLREMAALAGYKDGIELDVNLNMNIADMSDAELFTEYKRAQSRLAQLDEAEEADFIEVDELPDYLR